MEETTITTFPRLQVVIFVLGLLILLSTMVYATANAQIMQQEPQPLRYPSSPPILAAYLEIFPYSSNQYHIQAPADIDLSRFVDGRVFPITSDDQAWITILNDSGSFGIDGNLYNKIQNETHITTEILNLSGGTIFKRINEDLKTGVTRYDLEPGFFSVENIFLSQAQFLLETYKNGTGVLNIY
jgi:hypothetical protein